MSPKTDGDGRLCVGVRRGIVVIPAPAVGQRSKRVKELIQNSCAGCHRLEGKPDSRFNLQAPDLIWAGSKYQRSWLLRYLTGKEAPLYPKGLSMGSVGGTACGIRSSTRKKPRHRRIFRATQHGSSGESRRVRYLKVSKFDATFGGMAYKAHACLGCHLVEENGKLIGGPQSASLAAAGQRYNPDWLFRFGQNPQDFHSTQR